MRTGIGHAFGSCGELLQGVLPDGRNFLVTLPIQRGSTAVFEPSVSPGLRIEPAHKTKARCLAEGMLRDSPTLCGGHLTIYSDLAEGKGLASSTADLVATARAVAAAENRQLAATDIEARLRAIEPSDGVMYSGTVAFCHQEVRLLQRLSSPPPLTIVLGDEGGTVDTVEFNRQSKPFPDAQRAEYGDLLQRLDVALAKGDARTVGAVATRSAELNNVLRDRPHLGATIDATRTLGGLGVVIGHSGTTTGILIADDDPDYRAKVTAARRIVHGFAQTVSIHRTWRSLSSMRPVVRAESAL